MSGLRAQLGWMVRGRTHTVGALDGLANDLRSLQQQVAMLEQVVQALQAGQAAADRRQLDEFDRLRTAVAAATDDLTARVEATRTQISGGS